LSLQAKLRSAHAAEVVTLQDAKAAQARQLMQVGSARQMPLDHVVFPDSASTAASHPGSVQASQLCRVPSAAPQAQQEILKLSDQLLTMEQQQQPQQLHVQREKGQERQHTIAESDSANNCQATSGEGAARSPLLAGSTTSVCDHPQQQQQQQPQQQQTTAQGQPNYTDLRSLLAERDAQLASLEAELAVSRAALLGAAELPDEAGAAAQVLLLQRQLTDTSAALTVSQQRVAELEAAQALCAAAAEEGELLVAQQQHYAGAAAREAARQQTEAAVARTTSARYVQRSWTRCRHWTPRTAVGIWGAFVAAGCFAGGVMCSSGI
jgi:chromosome segregation ATPase